MVTNTWHLCLVFGIIFLITPDSYAETSVEGYDVEIDNSKQTCDDTNRITALDNSDETKCKTQCDANSECLFFYFNVAKWCVLYSSCTEKRTAGKLGSTYKKVIVIEPSSANVVTNREQTNVLLEVAPYPRPTYGYVEQDKTESKCIPTKDYAGTNVYAGMTGYDTFVGNPTDAIVDPGVKSRIFLHDCKFGYYSFISDVGGDLNCESDFSMKRISSMDAYDEERTSSNKFTMSASLAVTASYAGAKGEVAAAYSRATNADEQASVKVLNKYGGEIVQAKATCITMSVSIADNVRPLFTQDFVNHLRDMDEAIELNDEDEKTKTWKAFVTEFGTHFMRTTKLGAQIIYERRLETKATSTTEMKRRSECVAFEASASLKAEGYGSSVDAAASGGRDDCEGVTQGSDFSQKEGFEGIKILSRGSRPTDLHSWVDQEFDPVPVERYLDPISVLFRNDWLAKSTFFGFEKSLDGEKIEEMFLEKVKSYCSIMLDSTLDADCNYKVCNNDEWKDKCKNGGECKDEGGLPQCECKEGFLGDYCEEEKNVDLPAFDGYCLDAADTSDDFRPGSVTNDAKGCEEKCQEKEGCTAFSFTSNDEGLCTLYQNGPYTHGDGTEKTKCYTTLQGYDKLEMMHCWEKKYDYYATLTDATTACSTDGSCMGVYDHGCEEKGYYLCPQGSIQEVWFTNEIKSCVHIKTGAKFCLKYQTATAGNADASSGNSVEVVVSFADSKKTFKLDAPKNKGVEEEICDYSTPDLELQGVTIRQTESSDAWLIRSLQFPKFVGSPFYSSYALNSKNEMFWVDGDKNCRNDENEKNGLECCANKDECDLVLVTGVPCCTQLNVKSNGPSKSAIADSYFGVYNYFDRDSNGKIIWRHENTFYYLFAIDSSKQVITTSGDVGWAIGMDYSEQTGTKIAIICGDMCPGDCSTNWQYNDFGWNDDSDLEIACANSKATTSG